eukprot:6189837-Pleurochrysis_carterae.AAC.3
MEQPEDGAQEASQSASQDNEVLGTGRQLRKRVNKCAFILTVYNFEHAAGSSTAGQSTSLFKPPFTRKSMQII